MNGYVPCNPPFRRHSLPIFNNRHTQRAHIGRCSSPRPVGGAFHAGHILADVPPFPMMIVTSQLGDCPDFCGRTPQEWKNGTVPFALSSFYAWGSHENRIGNFCDRGCGPNLRELSGLRTRLWERQPKRADAGRRRHGRGKSRPAARRSLGNFRKPGHAGAVPRDASSASAAPGSRAIPRSPVRRFPRA